MVVRLSAQLQDKIMLTDGISQLTSDIVQIQIPLPYALNSVNCYLLRGRDGWTLLDTGLNTAAARSQWQRAMQALNISAVDIRQIVLTHTHPDHFGLAGWWQRQVDSPMPLILPQREESQMRSFYRGENTALYHRWMLDCGLGRTTVESVESALGSTRDLTQPHPLRQAYLTAGSKLRLGERVCRAIHAPGHSDGQLIFYDEADQLLLCGDHVLMRISPNIGSWPHSEPDPLGRYLASLQALTSLDVRLALPGHKGLIHDWRGRIDELIAHHDQRLEQTAHALAAGAGAVYEVSAQLFNLDRLTAHEWRFAMAETLAHLNYLRERGRAHCETNGIMRWSLAGD